MKSWALSVALHGTVLGLAVALWPEAPLEPEPEPFRWDVALNRQAAPSPPARPEPAPPAKRLPPRPTPPPHAPPLPATHEPTPIATAVALPAASTAATVAPAPVPAKTTESTDPTAIATSVPPPLAPAMPAAATWQQAGPTEDALADEAERRWQAAFLAHLRQLRRYPLVARRLGQEGVAVLDLRVDAQGRLESLEIRRHSGHPLLDQDALRLAREAADMTRPGRVPGRALRLEVPIAYRLQDG